jgi:hypothetical protein
MLYLCSNRAPPCSARPGLASHSCCIVTLRHLSFAHQGPACLAAHPHLPATTSRPRSSPRATRRPLLLGVCTTWSQGVSPYKKPRDEPLFQSVPSARPAPRRALAPTATRVAVALPRDTPCSRPSLHLALLLGREPRPPPIPLMLVRQHETRSQASAAVDPCYSRSQPRVLQSRSPPPLNPLLHAPRRPLPCCTATPYPLVAKPSPRIAPTQCHHPELLASSE